MFEDVAHYVAPAATMIAACMTAANLGPRITGWGFAIFTVGSLSWCIIGIASGQQSLVLTNAFLTLVNIIGIWRWLGRIARFDDGAKAAEAKSNHADTPTLVNVGAIEGRSLMTTANEKIGQAIGMMADADSGKIAYVVAGLGGVGGVGERLVAFPWDKLKTSEDKFVVTLTPATISDLPDLDPADWPTDCNHPS